MGQGLSTSVEGQGTHPSPSQQQQQEEQALSGLEPPSPLQQSESPRITEAPSKLTVDGNSRVPPPPGVGVDGASQEQGLSAANPPPKAFSSVPAQAPSTTASSTAAPSPTPSNAFTAATSSAARPKRKLDANKFFQAVTPKPPAQQQPTPASAPPTSPPPTTATAPPPSSAIPPSFHPNAPNSSVRAAANVAVNDSSQRFSTLPAPANHGAPYYYHSPEMANQQPVGVGGPPQPHLQPVQPATDGPRSPRFSSRPPINGADVGPPPTVMQHPHVHQNPHQPPYMQPPSTPHQPFSSTLPPTQQPLTPSNTMSPRVPIPALPQQDQGGAIPQINTNLPPSVQPTPAPGRTTITTSLIPSALEFVPSNLGTSSPMIPSPGFPLPKKSNAKISNPNTGEQVVLRPPDGGHSSHLSVSRGIGVGQVHESSPLRKAPIKMETQEEKAAREEKERKAKPPPLMPVFPRALALARHIDDLDSVTYLEGIKTAVELNRGQVRGGNYTYGRDFLLQFMQICKEKPENLCSLDGLGIERGAAPSFGSVGRGSRSRMGSMGPPPGQRLASGSIGLGLSGFQSGKGPAPFVMGNFSSVPTRMTSEERFAGSNTRDKTVSTGSGFPRGVTMSRSSSQGGVGGIGAVPPSPREQNRVRSQRGRSRNDSLKPNAPQPSQQQHQQQQALCRLEPVAPLQASENQWTPVARSRLAVNENSPEYVERKVKVLLNKLTPENFDSVSNQIINWANKSENEENGATLILVIKLVSEKAKDEELWSETYARLCRKTMDQISQNVQDDNIRNNSGEPIVGGHLFRKYLLNRCREDFERGWSRKESAQAAAALKPADANGENGEPVFYSDEYYALLKAKRQGLGLVRFIGELFKLVILTERMMHERIKKLLSKVDNPEEEEIESLCKLLTTVGQVLDTPKAKGHMDIYFGKIRMLADNPNVSRRIWSKLLDVIELRHRSWKPRNATAGPSTIAQDAKEKTAAVRQASRVVPMTRGGLQRGGRSAPEQGPDGWNVAGPTPVRAPAKAGNLSNFGKLTA